MFTDRFQVNTFAKRADVTRYIRFSRVETQQPVQIEPGTTASDLYTFANPWHATLFGSFKPCYRASFACCCLPCYAGKQADRVNEHFLTLFVNPCSLMALRTKVRASFHIRGNLTEDCYTTMCCTCACAAMQIEKELDYQDIPSKQRK